MANQLSDTRAKLISHFAQVESSTDRNQKWDALWKDGFCPWDRGCPNPALIDLLEERQDLLPFRQQSVKKTALVPGCGKGYDVFLLAAYGFNTYGLEISETALEKAKSLEKELETRDAYKTKDGVERGEIKWLVGDFFDEYLLRSFGQEGKFDLIYDYTFLSALPPFMRPAWSSRMLNLLANDGRIICVEFPTYKPHSTGGPPWALPPKVYEAHLSRPGIDLEYSETEGLIEDKLREPSVDRLCQISHFQPTRTHSIGYDPDGNVTDWIGVWAHFKT
ncbi:hypothetical protein K3495_g5153 [Podosphaera aphanis]|nr:hypothetical protein K3495_g5153 [Podosphaera aphanis]